ncbi:MULTISPECIES: molybdopterin-binding protein [Clostridium]|uniref:Molybdopterin molybdenumtransferase n=1 Tax=Clostridium frigoriphilum TaxID=443253 RepID=A0ABU7UUR5_9CLOT|nr:molybdopterin-binding protein [Clostridium sp. DSM 17811]MBU3101208.1 molybdopterin-binding protein [Clostridium sp. DSM 17811]
MKTVSVYDSVGMVLVHDMTQIIPGKYKGSRFKKGYVVKEQDIPVLLEMGKENLFVINLEDDGVHEDEAAIRIAKAAAGIGIELKVKGEGKIELVALYDGLLQIDVDKLMELIDQEEVVFATLHKNQVVKQGQVVAGTRVIPLFIREKIVSTAETVCLDNAIIKVTPLKSLKVGLVTTGSEIYHGRIKDAFGPILDKKFGLLGSTVVHQIISDDNDDMIADSIKQLLFEKVDMVAVTGGMSVDRDDRTPSGIRKAGGKVVTYGASVLPGAMFLLAYIGDIPVVGLPGCVMYHKISIFDLIIPRIMAGDKPTRSDIKKLAHGGLCRNCETCTYPNCGFGKAF